MLPSFLGLWVTLMFQSIYTYKRRWNAVCSCSNDSHNVVSIHLYLQEALELCLTLR